MAVQKLNLKGGIFIESRRDHNGRYWTGYARNCSMYFRDPKELVKFLSLYSSSERKEKLLAWLDELLEYDSRKRDSNHEDRAQQHG